MKHTMLLTGALILSLCSSVSYGQDVVIRIVGDRFVDNASQPLNGSVSVRPGSRLIVTFEDNLSGYELRVEQAGVAVAPYDLGSGKDVAIAVAARSSFSITLHDGNSLKDRLYVNASSRDDGPMRLDIGYAFARLANDTFFRTNSDTIGKARSGSLEDAAMLMVHFVAPRRVNENLAKHFKWLGYERDEIAFAFSFGLPAPGTGTTIEYAAGGTILFGSDRNLGVTLGVAFGNVDRLRSDLSVGDTLALNQEISLTTRTVTGWFVSISYRLPG